MNSENKNIKLEKGVCVLSNYCGYFYDGTICEVIKPGEIWEPLQKLEITENTKFENDDETSQKPVSDHPAEPIKYKIMWTDRHGNSDLSYPDPYECLEKDMARDIVPIAAFLKIGQKILYDTGSKYAGCNGGYQSSLWQIGTIDTCCQGLFSGQDFKNFPVEKIRVLGPLS